MKPHQKLHGCHNHNIKHNLRGITHALNIAPVTFHPCDVSLTSTGQWNAISRLRQGSQFLESHCFDTSVDNCFFSCDQPIAKSILQQDMETKVSPSMCFGPHWEIGRPAAEHHQFAGICHNPTFQKFHFFCEHSSKWTLLLQQQ